ncbi:MULTISPECIES: hypothetical protein [unclassified Mesorhizobium]|uniref:hypothetical protein n=1 Tax=unclassified Mesorhizobium TaxID=325217 RepID=UPI000FCAC933|nr:MULTISPECIES: hypothetical protein [unclassified Mesorhizobium]RVD61120.1 hypothetical protein EN750_22910 [Mesorhizobium sp. M7A.F.Ca.ET.027.03.2.1]RWO88709.1 MAG: hypothetical protein EOQ96_06385 [Mesorhizobium sp.]RWP00547.1 MAG: hypothetical protein EOQ97_26925 [Mesorhizobium sp.]RWP87251.1 MAG: hypothetical protein EOR12_19765 [Mesorhizobium sp.]TIM93726.1 MAG: hypothetical protein E5Y34_32350 [Mesorhizobium sp.]
MAEGSWNEPAMDARRFAVLAQAYGGDLRRWPEAERMAGTVFAASGAGKAILRQAGTLDALLDSYRVDAPDKALHGSILQAAGRHLVQRRRKRFWWLGLGLAGIGLAGAVAGLALVTIVTPEVQPDHYVLDANATAFGDAGPAAENGEESL